MSYNAKITISNTFEALLEKNTIKTITVSNIVNLSGLSRQTFYNNFTDIDDLIRWTHDTNVKEAIDAFWGHKNFKKSFASTLNVIYHHKNFYTKIIRGNIFSSFEKYFACQSIELSKKYLGNKVNENIAFALELYWSGASASVVRWIADGMNTSPEDLSELFYDSLPIILKQYYL